MLKQIKYSISVNAPLHILDVPGIVSLTKLSTTPTSDRTHPPTYECLHGKFILENVGNKKLISHKTDLMSLITIFNSNC